MKGPLPNVLRPKNLGSHLSGGIRQLLFSRPKWPNRIPCVRSSYTQYLGPPLQRSLLTHCLTTSLRTIRSPSAASAYPRKRCTKIAAQPAYQHMQRDSELQPPSCHKRFAKVPTVVAFLEGGDGQPHVDNHQVSVTIDGTPSKASQSWQMPLSAPNLPE